jgi:hypothetical protein
MSVEQVPAQLADIDAANATALDANIVAIFIKSLCWFSGCVAMIYRALDDSLM